MPRLASKVTIDNNEHKVLIDDEEFPYHIAERGPSAESLVADAGVYIIDIPVIAEHLEIIGPDSDSQV